MTWPRACLWVVQWHAPALVRVVLAPHARVTLACTLPPLPRRAKFQTGQHGRDARAALVRRRRGKCARARTSRRR